jgi:hypothetical protein
MTRPPKGRLIGAARYWNSSHIANNSQLQSLGLGVISR